ncbi:MAG TPA: T9SS type A sorting domain-containing protein, partial [Candidatus Kapabacteria bacterium]|nr:T9SS type A sorting domain-containing protein [Candidatus Kapabacteria bacterium]
PPHISGMLFSDTSFICGYSSDTTLFYNSTDCGLTWNFFPVNAPFYKFDDNHLVVNKISAPSANAIFIVQNRPPTVLPEVAPKFIASFDSGKTWIKKLEDAPLIAVIQNFTMWTAQKGFILYQDTSKNYHCAVTNDGCQTFDTIKPDKPLSDLFNNRGSNPILGLCPDSVNWVLWIGGVNLTSYSHLIVTHDGGRNWAMPQLMTPQGDTTVRLSASISIITYKNYKDTYIIQPNTPKPFFYYSTDYGDHWFTIDTSSVPSEIAFSFPLSHLEFWAVGWDHRGNHSGEEKNIFYYSNDGAKHWEADSVSAFDYDVTSLTFIDSVHGFAVARKSADSKIYLLKYQPSMASVTGLEDTSTKVELFPNPTMGIMKVNSSSEVISVSVSNVLGERVLILTRPIINLDFSQLDDGWYFVELKLPKRVIRQKILKLTQ